MRTLFFLTIICWANHAVAQNPSTSALQWSLGQGTDLRNNQSFDYSGSLSTNGTLPVTWQQKSMSSTFTVASINGVWTDVKQKGQLVFVVQDDSAIGTITVGRDSKGLFAIMEFPEDDPQGSKVRWKVTNVLGN